MMKGLVQRLITAIIFVAVMLGGLFAGQIYFLLLFGLISGMCLWEFSGIVMKGEKSIRRRILGLVLGMYPFGFFALGRMGIDIPEAFGAVFLLLLFSVFLFELTKKDKDPFKNIGYILTGVIYIGLPFTLLTSDTFIGFDYSPHLIFSTLLLVWASDTGAYLVGSLIGKTPLAPIISPKKTWEGTVGGWVFSLLISVALYYIYKGELLELWQFTLLALTCGVFGTLGDLVESMLKRSYGIKDSGSLLPGHGGLLDRFDAFILVVPFVYVLLSFF
jgi:phosphatidate cytidylyltransferase